MASNGKKKTTMAKLNRERRLQEKRLDKRARKERRKEEAANPTPELDPNGWMSDERITDPDEAAGSERASDGDAAPAQHL